MQRGYPCEAKSCLLPWTAGRGRTEDTKLKEEKERVMYDEPKHNNDSTKSQTIRRSVLSFAQTVVATVMSFAQAVHHIFCVINRWIHFGIPCARNDGSQRRIPALNCTAAHSCTVLSVSSTCAAFWANILCCLFKTTWITSSIRIARLQRVTLTRHSRIAKKSSTSHKTWKPGWRPLEQSWPGPESVTYGLSVDNQWPWQTLWTAAISGHNLRIIVSFL